MMFPKTKVRANNLPEIPRENTTEKHWADLDDEQKQLITEIRELYPKTISKPKSGADIDSDKMLY